MFSKLSKINYPYIFISHELAKKLLNNTSAALTLNMSRTAPLMRQFCLSLIFVVMVCQVASSNPVNKTTSDGKVFITGDHNEVILSTSQETKKALAEIKSKLDTLNEKDEEFAERILSLENRVKSLEEHTGRKLDLLNKSNAVLSLEVQAMSQRLSTLEKQGTRTKLFCK